MVRMLTLSRIVLMICLALIGTAAMAQQGTQIPPGAKVYIQPIGGFETYLAAAISKKRVPVLVVANREQADFEITGVWKSERNSVWRGVFLRQGGSQEDASIQVTNIGSGVVAFAYAVEKPSSRPQAAAESCAKHLKKKIEKSM